MTTHDRSADPVLDAQVERILRGFRLVAGQQGRVEPALFGIVGERGTGKTTLLRQLVHSAGVENEFLVLPITSPENLHASESLAAIAIARLCESLENYAGSPQSDEARALGERALRSTLLGGSSNLRDLFDSTISLGQFSIDSSAIVRRSVEMAADLARFLESAMAVANVRGIVVPIDDMDLSPGRLTRILSDVRVLGECPGLLPIVCLSWTDLRAHLKSELQVAVPAGHSHQIDRMVEQQIMKTLRPDRIFEPLQLPHSRKFDYSPELGKRSLSDLLGELFGVLDADGEQGLVRWLEDGRLSMEDSTFNLDWLPDTFRGLAHLYYEIDGTIGSAYVDEEGIEFGHRLRAFLTSIARTNGLAGFELELFSADASSSAGSPRLHATANWPNYKIFVGAPARWERVSSGPGTRFMLRRAGEFVCTREDEQLPGGSTVEGRRRVPKQEFSAACMIDSIVSTETFAGRKPHGGPVVIDDSAEFLQNFRVFGLPTNDRILMLPGTAGIVGVGRWQAAWNWMVDSIAEDARKSPSSQLVSNLCIAVSKIWMDGEDPELVRPVSSLSTAIELAASHYGTLFPRREGNATKFWRDAPAIGYLEWFESLLPFCFHDGLLTESEISECLQVWVAAISEGKSGTDAQLRLASNFERKLDSASGARPKERMWLYGYRRLIREIAPALLADLQEFAKEYEERVSRGSKGRNAVRTQVEIDVSDGEYRFATRPNARGQAERDRVMRVLDQLRNQ